jgi:hypothetical protein
MGDIINISSDTFSLITCLWINADNKRKRRRICVRITIFQLYEYTNNRTHNVLYSSHNLVMHLKYRYKNNKSFYTKVKVELFLSTLYKPPYSALYQDMFYIKM